MSKFKIATWNVNSLRVRLAHVLEWLDEHQPDVLALQEIKLMEDQFPAEEFVKRGYSFVASGQKAYNGVAIISKNKIEDVVFDLPGPSDPQRRVLAVTVKDMRIINLYVPNGEHVTSEKYTYKLNWLNNLKTFLQTEIVQHPKAIMLGDFNIAPEELDVHNPKRWLGKVLFSDPERQALRDILQIGFHDCFRLLSPLERDFSWWDYRLQAFEKNMGCRIDHIFASSPLSTFCSHCFIDKKPRALLRPSDHAPVIAEFSFTA